MSDIYFIVLLVIGILILFFVVFLLYLTLHALASADFGIKEITDTVHRIENMLLQLKGAETAAHEQTKSEWKICSDMLQADSDSNAEN